MPPKSASKKSVSAESASKMLEPSTSKMSASLDDSTDNGDTQCTVCFEDFTSGGDHRLVVLKCGHLFGRSCVERWIRVEKNPNCPTCKGKAKMTDVRNIFGKRIRMVDNSEFEEVKAKYAKLENETGALKEEKVALAEERDILAAEKLSLIEAAETLRSENLALTEELGRVKNELNKLYTYGGLIRPPLLSVAKMITTNAHAPLVVERKLNRSLELRLLKKITHANENGSRLCMDVLEHTIPFIILACRTQLQSSAPFGLMKISSHGEIVATINGVHARTIRDCRISPFDSDLVLSVGEDSKACVTSFSRPYAKMPITHGIQLDAQGWTCDWISADVVVIGMSNGIVRQYTLVDDEKTMIQEFDWTKGGARHPVLNVKWVASTRSLLVATMQNVIMCKEQQSSLSEPTSTPLIKKNGPIRSCSYDEKRDAIMISFWKETNDDDKQAVFEYYTVSFHEKKFECTLVCQWTSFATPTAPLVRHALWSIEGSNASSFAAIFEGAKMEIVVFNWDATNAIAKYQLVSENSQSATDVQTKNVYQILPMLQLKTLPQILVVLTNESLLFIELLS